MDVDERRKKILNLLDETGKIKVKDLSSKFSVSEVSIRKDLADMEKENSLERIHGGAIPSMRIYSSMNFYERQTKNAEEKRRIARSTAEMIREGDTIMISSGTTAYFVAMELKNKKDLKIVTNSISIALDVADCPGIHVILLGGNIKVPHRFTYGDEAILQLKRFKADTAILSVDGVCAEAGITANEWEEPELNRIMIERSSKVIAIADYSKIGREAFAHTQSLEYVDYLVTNTNASQEELEKIIDCGVEVICV